MTLFHHRESECFPFYQGVRFIPKLSEAKNRVYPQKAITISLSRGHHGVPSNEIRTLAVRNTVGHKRKPRAYTKDVVGALKGGEREPSRNPEIASTRINHVGYDGGEKMYSTNKIFLFHSRILVRTTRHLVGSLYTLLGCV